MKNILIIICLIWFAQNAMGQTTYNVNSRMRIKSANGYIDVGAQNNQWGHIYTDRANFMFNKDVWSWYGGFSSYGSYNLSLRTNGTTRMTIVNSNGNIGIGTSSPSYKLHVKGDIYADGGWMRVSGQKGIYFQSYGGGFYMTDGSWIRTYGNKNFYHNTGIMRTDGTFQVGGNGDRFVVMGDGKIGVAVTAPTEKLDINGSLRVRQININNELDKVVVADATGKLHYREMATISSNAAIAASEITYDNSISGLSASNLQSAVNEINSNIYWNRHANDDIGFLGGNVGIGTTTPDAKLTIKGDIHAERVKVDLNIPAPDYVFEEDYELRSLEETASYIQENKHLPEVPSAKELEVEGIDLVEMNMLLLKKIEELTLYVIHLKNENEDQKQRLEKVEKNLSRVKGQ